VTPVRSPLTSVRTHLLSTLGRSHVAGPSITDAVRVGGEEADAGAWLTLGPWRSRRDSPTAVLSAYQDAISAIAEAALPATLSIKLPDLDFDDDLVAEVLDTAARHGVELHVDSMKPGTEVRTLERLPDLVAAHPALGVTLPGRWARSVADAELVADAGVRSIRVVKGQWADPADPKRDAVRGVLDVVHVLRGGVATVGVATHDEALALDCLDRLVGAGTECRVEQLYGMPRLDVHGIEARFGVGHLVYVPYGEAYLPYAVARAVRDPRILTWIARDLIRSRAPGPTRSAGRRWPG
jgi:proline dehydrogenase